MTPTVGIVLINHNGLADTRNCLRSLAGIDYSRYFPLVVDNASSDDPTELLQSEFPGCQVIRRDVNGGWAGGSNAGIRACRERRADYVILLNNDTRVDPGLATRLVKAVESNRGYGILGPVIRHYDPPGDIQTEGCMFNRPNQPELFQRRTVPLAKGERPSITQVDIVNGCCMMIAAPVFRKIGLIDERFFLVHEESDFCLRARNAGFRCGVIGEALVWHKGSQSFRRSGLRAQRYYDARNLLLLLSKHGYRPGPRRGQAASLVQYLKYAYARYEMERASGCDDAATAVLEGVCDALLRRYGPHRDGRRPGLAILKAIFDFRLGRPRTASPPMQEPEAAA